MSSLSSLAVQVPPEHYGSLSYDTKERFVSYWHQIEAVLRHRYQSVLEVGPGNGFVTRYLRAHGVLVTTLDLDPALSPDLVGSTTAIPASTGSFDAVLCSQVLEHMPFEHTEASLREMHRVAREGAIVSVPEITPYLRVEIQTPLLGHRRWLLPRPWARTPKHMWTPLEHHWEIGLRGYPLKRVLSALEAAGWMVEGHYRLYDNPYHHFFELRASS